MRFTLSTELSEQEVYLIGSIVAQWGFIENEIFEQTILSFPENEDLPGLMKTNAQFNRVLQLWLERVAEAQIGEKKVVLLAQYKKIMSLNEFRQAVVHSRWEWKPEAPDEITAVRSHKQTVKRVKFTSEDLADFATTLGEIRFCLCYPGGLADRAEEMVQAGGYMSREFLKQISGRSTLRDPTESGENE